MDIKAIQKALSKIPQLKEIESEESDGKVDDLLSAAEEFTKIVRKLGVRQMRDSQDLLSNINKAISDSEIAKQAAERERERAVKSERFSKNVINLLIGNIDLFDRIILGMKKDSKNEAWISEIESSITYLLRELEKIGIIESAKVDDPFDSALHDIEGTVPEGVNRHTVKRVVVRGFVWDGQVVRRALIEL